MTAICDMEGFAVYDPSTGKFSSSSRSGVQPFKAFFKDDFSSYSIDDVYTGWNSRSTIVSDHPGGVGRAIAVQLDGATPPVCGGSHVFGGYTDFPQPVPVGKTVWYAQWRYHSSAQTWGYCFGGGDTPCPGQSADGTTYLKDLVMYPSTDTARIYVQPTQNRRSVAQTAGHRITTEVGPIFADSPSVSYPLDQWFFHQVMVKVADDGTGIIRHWINRQLISELTGQNVTSGNSLKGWGVGNYFNGIPFLTGDPNQDTFWIRNIIIASDIDGFDVPTGLDDEGNIFIDPNTDIAELT